MLPIPSDAAPARRDPHPPRHIPAGQSAAHSTLSHLTMVLRTSATLALGAFASMTATAQTPVSGPQGSGQSSEITSSPQRLLEQWREDHGAGWRMLTNPKTGTMEMLFGSNAQSPFEPNTSVPEDWFAIARYWAQETYQMHGIEDVELTSPSFRYLPLAMGNTTDKVSVRFEQVVAGVPVEQSAFNVLFDTQGRLLSIHTTGAPSVEDKGVKPLINEIGRASCRERV